MGIRDGFTSDEWQLLQFAPLWVFGAVAAIDNNIDDKEKTALAKALMESALFKNDLAREVLSSLAVGIAKVMPAWAADSRTAIDGLAEVADLLDAKAKNDAEGFKRSLLLIGRNIAEASGGGIFGLGSKTSDDEMKAMIGCAAQLRGVL